MARKRKQQRSSTSAATAVVETSANPLENLRSMHPDDFIAWASEHWEALRAKNIIKILRALPDGGSYLEMSQQLFSHRQCEDEFEKGFESLRRAGYYLPAAAQYNSSSLLMVLGFLHKLVEGGKVPQQLAEIIKTLIVPILSFLQSNQASSSRKTFAARCGTHEFVTTELVELLATLVLKTKAQGLVELAAGSGILFGLLRKRLEPSVEEGFSFYAFDSQQEHLEKSVLVNRQTMNQYYKGHRQGLSKHNQVIVVSWPRHDIGDTFRKIIDKAKEAGSHVVVIGDYAEACLLDKFYEDLQMSGARIIELPHRSVNAVANFSRTNLYEGRLSNSIIRIICFEGALLFSKSREEIVDFLEVDVDYLLPERTPIDNITCLLQDYINTRTIPVIDVPQLIVDYQECGQTLDQLRVLLICSLLSAAPFSTSKTGGGSVDVRLGAAKETIFGYMLTPPEEVPLTLKQAIKNKLASLTSIDDKKFFLRTIKEAVPLNHKQFCEEKLYWLEVREFFGDMVKAVRCNDVKTKVSQKSGTAFFQHDDQEKLIKLKENMFGKDLGIKYIEVHKVKDSGNVCSKGRYILIIKDFASQVPHIMQKMSELPGVKQAVSAFRQQRGLFASSEASTSKLDQTQQSSSPAK